MNERFESELDCYERELTARVGGSAAADARREMASHLQASYDAQIEAGLEPDRARIAVLEAVGNLNGVAHEERRSVSLASMPWNEIGLVAAASLLWATWSISGLNVGIPRMVLTVTGLAVLLGAAIPGTRADRTTYNPLTEVVVVILPILFFALYLAPVVRSMAGTVVLPTVGLATVGSLILSAAGAVVALLVTRGLARHREVS